MVKDSPTYIVEDEIPDDVFYWRDKDTIAMFGGPYYISDFSYRFNKYQSTLIYKVNPDCIENLKERIDSRNV